ncbi:MAG: murein biosynthesis integral membrane protein MurJ [Gammaproteobacteria bacterium]|nr:MAG: murein biosynthesis integral membrane protein MurJ [Gammaproteobacteria bacterium]
MRSGAMVSLMTMVSRVLGLARDILFASLLGVSAVTDAFFVAFRIPNFLRRLFAEGAFSQAFVPVLSEYRTKYSVAEVQMLVNAVSGTLGLVLLLLTTIAVLGAPAITAVFAPGFVGDDELFGLTSQMLRITFPYLLLISLTAFASAVLNSYGRFAVPAFTPVWLNVCLMLGVFLGVRYSDQPVIVVSWAVLLAGVVQLVFQMPFLARIRLLPRPKADWKHPGVKQVMTLMLPAMFGVSVSQINLLLDTMLASFLPTGSISWLYYSDRLTELPLGVFGIAVATVVLPSLSRNHASQSSQVFSHTLAWGVRTVMAIALPATMALFLLAEPIIATLFQYHKTTPHDVQMAGWSLRAYTLGLSAFMLVKVLAPGFYARQDTRTPVGIGIKAMVANMVMNLLFVVPLHYSFQLGHMGLALATSAAAWLNAGLLWRTLRQQGVWVWPENYRGSVLRMLLVTVLMGAVLVWMTPAMADWFAWGWQERVSHILLLCGAGMLVYFAGLRLTGFRLSDFRHHA